MSVYSIKCKINNWHCYDQQKHKNGIRITLKYNRNIQLKAAIYFQYYDNSFRCAFIEKYFSKSLTHSS